MRSLLFLFLLVPCALLHAQAPSIPDPTPAQLQQIAADLDALGKATSADVTAQALVVSDSAALNEAQTKLEVDQGAQFVSAASVATTFNALSADVAKLSPQAQAALATALSRSTSAAFTPIAPQYHTVGTPPLQMPKVQNVPAAHKVSATPGPGGFYDDDGKWHTIINGNVVSDPPHGMPGPHGDFHGGDFHGGFDHDDHGWHGGYDPHWQPNPWPWQAINVINTIATAPRMIMNPTTGQAQLMTPGQWVPTVVNAGTPQQTVIYNWQPLAAWPL